MSQCLVIIHTMVLTWFPNFGPTFSSGSSLRIGILEADCFVITLILEYLTKSLFSGMPVFLDKGVFVKSSLVLRGLIYVSFWM